MYIDAHQHFWRYDPREYGWIGDSMAALRRDFLPADLKLDLDRNGFQGCVAVQARSTVEETRWLLELAERASFILGVVGWVDIRSPRLRVELESFKGKAKLVGVRHLVQDEPDERFLLQPDFLRGIAMLEEFDLSYDILIYTRHLPVTAEFVKRFPRQRFVLDHLAKPPIKSGALEPWARDIRALAAFPNVYCKASGMVTEADWRAQKPADMRPYLDVVFDCFGASRLMIGSDWPVCTVAGSYSLVMDVVKNYIDKHSAEEKNAVLGGNAAKFWRLKMPENQAGD
jgi:L-fuconolactonase